MIELIKGESFTIGILFNPEYDRANIEAISLNVSRKIYPAVWDATMYKVTIPSEDTMKFVGRIDLVLNLKESNWGVRKPKIGSIQIVDSASCYNNEAISDGYNAIAEVTINETAITVSTTIINALAGSHFIDGGDTEAVYQQDDTLDEGEI